MIIKKPWDNRHGIRSSSKPFTHRTLEERAKEYGGKLGVYEEMDFGEPVGREERIE